MRQLDGITDSRGMSLSKLQEIVKGSLAFCSHKKSDTTERVNSHNMYEERKREPIFNVNQFFNCLFIYWLLWVFIAALRLTLVGNSGGYSLVVVCGLLIALASLVAEQGLTNYGAWA